MSKPKPQVIEDEEHQRVFERVAAIDVAKASGWCASGCRAGTAGPGRARSGGASSDQRGHRLGRACSATGSTVTLEATSDYWRIFYYLLEALGLAVQLVSRRRPAAQGAPEDR